MSNLSSVIGIFFGNLGKNLGIHNEKKFFFDIVLFN